MTLAPTLSPVTAQMKRKQVRVYLDPEKEEQFTKLVDAIGSMSESTLMSVLVSAALHTCVEAGYRMPLPLKFKFHEGIPEPSKLTEKLRR